MTRRTCWAGGCFWERVSVAVSLPWIDEPGEWLSGWPFNDGRYEFSRIYDPPPDIPGVSEPLKQMKITRAILVQSVP